MESECPHYLILNTWKKEKEMTMTHPPPKYKTGPTLDLSEIA
jgi:hypothetical protein